MKETTMVYSATILIICLANIVFAANPVVIFHGFGDQCSYLGMKVTYSSLLFFNFPNTIFYHSHI